MPFRNYNGTPNLVTMFDPHKHATRRRMVSNLYSKSYLISSPDFRGLYLAIIYGRLLPMIDEAARAGSGVDVFEISRAVAAEMMSAYQLGLENGLDLTSPARQTTRKRHLDNGTKKLRGGKGSNQAGEELEDECFAMCLKADERLRSAGEKESIAGKATEDLAQEGSRLPTTTRPIIFAQLSTDIPDKEGVQTTAETLRLVASELLDNIEAARVGIGITVTYAMYRLSQRPDLQAKLRAELSALQLPRRHPPHGPLSSSAPSDGWHPHPGRHRHGDPGRAPLRPGAAVPRGAQGRRRRRRVLRPRRSVDQHVAVRAASARGRVSGRGGVEAGEVDGGAGRQGREICGERGRSAEVVLGVWAGRENVCRQQFFSSRYVLHHFRLLLGIFQIRPVALG